MNFFTLVTYPLHNVLILRGENRISSLKLFFTFSGVSLTCYSCYSQVNWTHCDANRQKYICEPWLDVCAKSRASFDFRGIKFDVYERGCFSSDFCNTKACKFIGRAEDCDIKCCDFELCNDSAPVTHNKLLIGVSALFVLFKYVSYRWQWGGSDCIGKKKDMTILTAV